MSLSLYSKLLFSIIALSIAFLSALYIWQINVIIGKTYLRDSLSQRVKELNVRAAELAINRTQFASLNDLERQGAFSSLERIGKINYIRLLNGVVVRSSINERLAP